MEIRLSLSVYVGIGKEKSREEGMEQMRMPECRDLQTCLDWETRWEWIGAGVVTNAVTTPSQYHSIICSISVYISLLCTLHNPGS
jgi:hypothetical protein